MNTYEAKQAARKARYQERAGQAMQQSDAVAAQASQMASVIPMGQPILVGHHSERSDRRYRERISRSFEKSFVVPEEFIFAASSRISGALRRPILAG